MEVGDIVNIKNSKGLFWKGKIENISREYSKTLKSGEIITILYYEPIASVVGDKGKCATVNESDLIKKDGDYWEK